MEKFLLPALLFFIIANACKKTGIETTPPAPPVTDTTKPDAPDTVYLKKTEMNYYYDQAGNQILDSGFTVWTYNNKRQPITQIFTNFELGARDTSFYSYPANQYVNHTVSYNNGILISDMTETYYFNSAGNPDSVTGMQYFLSVNNGVQTPLYYDRVSYYYYNSENKDTLQTSYSIDNNIKTLTGKFQLFYAGGELDSAIGYDGANNINGITYYSHGDPVLINSYLNGALFETSTYTYYDVLSGGFYGYIGSSRLRQTLTVNFIKTPNGTTSQTINYEFDSSNRVKTTEYILSNNIKNQRGVYTYY